QRQRWSLPVAHDRLEGRGAVGKGRVAGGAGAVAVAQVPGGGRLAELAARVKGPDGIDAIAVPVADHGLPAGRAEAEGRVAGGAGAVAVAQVPGGRPLPALPARRYSPVGRQRGAVPVADHRLQARRAVGEGRVAGGARAVAVAQVPGRRRLSELADR